MIEHKSWHLTGLATWCVNNTNSEFDWLIGLSVDVKGEERLWRRAKAYLLIRIKRDNLNCLKITSSPKIMI